MNVYCVKYNDDDETHLVLSQSKSDAIRAIEISDDCQFGCFECEADMLSAYTVWLVGSLPEALGYPTLDNEYGFDLLAWGLVFGSSGEDDDDEV